LTALRTIRKFNKTPRQEKQLLIFKPLLLYILYCRFCTGLFSQKENRNPASKTTAVFVH